MIRFRGIAPHECASMVRLGAVPSGQTVILPDHILITTRNGSVVSEALNIIGETTTDSRRAAAVIDEVHLASCDGAARASIGIIPAAGDRGHVIVHRIPEPSADRG